MAAASFDLAPKSLHSFSVSREEKPEPVPPPKEWKMRNACKLSAFSH